MRTNRARMGMKLLGQVAFVKCNQHV